MLTIRTLRQDEFPKAVPICEAFYRECNGHLGDAFDGQQFLNTMNDLALLYQFCFFGVWNGDELLGGLGAYIQPDIFEAGIVAHDLFIYIKPEYRGQTPLRTLIHTYEQWARERGAKYAYLVHLEHGPFKDKFARVFDISNYRKMETAYRLDLREVSVCQS